ncbi:hypothetical protein [Actinoplanes sp. NPDC049265]|uniref:hypothetical protein n=1 Tax=Actinoplanes sp. NPDC049265 TaxID=3363902 RepID=UPI0037241AF9
MKLKLDKRTLIIVAVVVVVGVALLARSFGGSGDSGKAAQALDAAAVKACDDFAAGRSAAETAAARLSLADKVTKSTMDTDNDAIADQAVALGQDADDSRQWRAHADAFTKACTSNGWKQK